MLCILDWRLTLNPCPKALNSSEFHVSDLRGCRHHHGNTPHSTEVSLASCGGGYEGEKLYLMSLSFKIVALVNFQAGQTASGILLEAIKWDV